MTYATKKELIELGGIIPGYPTARGTCLIRKPHYAKIKAAMIAAGFSVMQTAGGYDYNYGAYMVEVVK